MGILSIGSKNFIAGESSADYISDRGFSPDSYHLNLTKVRGLLYFNESPTDRGGATLTGNIIASCADPALAGAADLGFIDDEGAIYTYSGTTLTKSATSAHAGTDSFQLGTSDLIPFKTFFYASLKEYVIQISSVWAVNNDEWWAGLTTSYRHPLEVVEDNMFIGDGNLIYFWNGTSSGTAFTLPTTVNVTSLRRHPDGVTLLAFCGERLDFSHTLPNSGRVYYCNTKLVGVTNKGWTREVKIASQVEGSRVVGGVIFVTWGTNLGYFDGNGLQLLRRLATSTTTYSQNLSNMEDILLIRDGLNILAYGDLGAGKVWWNCFRNLTNTNAINHLVYQGSSKLLVAFKGASAGTGLLQEQNYANAGVYGAFYSNRYDLGLLSQITRLQLFHDVSNVAGATRFVVSYRDIENTETTLLDRLYTNQSVSKTQEEVSAQSDIFQLALTPSQDDTGYRLIRVLYNTMG